MNNNNFKNKEKSHNQFVENNILDYSVNSGMLNIPIMPQLDSLASNPNLYTSNIPDISGNDTIKEILTR